MIESVIQKTTSIDAENKRLGRIGLEREANKRLKQ